MGIAGLYRFTQNGLRLFPESIEYAISGFSGAMLGVDILPSLLGVGFHYRD